MTFTEQEVIAMHADLAALCERMHKLIFVGEVVISNRL